MNFQMTPVPDYREECQGEGFAEVLSGAKPLRAGPTAKWSRQQTKISPRAPMRIMGAGERTKWIGNEKSALSETDPLQKSPTPTTTQPRSPLTNILFGRVQSGCMKNRQSRVNGRS
jgi:hypothetical protein